MKPLRVFCVRVGLNLYCCYLSGFFVVVVFFFKILVKVTN